MQKKPMLVTELGMFRFARLEQRPNTSLSMFVTELGIFMLVRLEQ